MNTTLPRRDNPMLQDRRAARRHEAIANRARVEWVEAGEIRGSPARLVNIGRGGALLVAEDPPPLHRAVWLRIEKPTRTDEVTATVVRHGDSGEVGLSFPEACPYDLHLAATLGINPCGMLMR